MTNASKIVSDDQQALDKGDFAAARKLMHDNLFPYRVGLAEGKATEHENYMEIYDQKTFIAAVTALFDQRTIEFTD